MRTFEKFSCCAIVFCMASISSIAQVDTVRRNTIKVDLTSYWLYRNAVVFSYEHILKKHPNHTWGITAGLQQFPKLGSLNTDSGRVTRDYNAFGLKLGGEYRIYLMKENKFNAPRGVYIGPYTTFHKYANTRLIEVNNDGVMENVELESDLNIFNIGVQLGYQFVFNDRWTVDMVFVGPALSNYVLKSNVKGNYTFDPAQITNEVVLAMIDKFPAFEQLINEGEINSKGKINTWGYGYRYQLQVGYRFGRKQ